MCNKICYVKIANTIIMYISTTALNTGHIIISGNVLLMIR